MKNTLFLIWVASWAFLASASDAHGTSIRHYALPLSTALEVRADAAATPAPDPTQSEDPPEITSDGSDVIIALDPDLAHQIDQAIRESTRCAAGAEFDREEGGKVKRAGDTLGQVICGASAVLFRTAANDQFHDLLALDASHFLITFSAAMAQLNRAANEVLQMMRDFQPIAQLSLAVRDQLVTMAVILAYQVLINGIPLAEENHVPTTLVSTSNPSATRSTSSSSSSSSSASCPDPTETPLMCGFGNNFDENNCEADLPKTKEEKPTCKSGDYDGCQCNMPFSKYVTNVARTDFDKLSQFLMSTLVKAAPVCNEEMTDVPKDVFLGDHSNVYENFCRAWNSWIKYDRLQWTVDSQGLAKAPDRANVDFDLTYMPKPNDGGSIPQCDRGCRDAFANLTSCVSEKDNGFLVMAKNGTLDVGCGYFSFDINGLPVPLTEQERHCYGKDEFGDHKPVDENTESNYARDTCGIPTGLVVPGDLRTGAHYEQESGGVPYQYDIRWKDGCVLAGLPQAMDVVKPIGGDLTCETLLKENYKKCDNGGAGGNIQVGCLVYDFKAQSGVFGN